MSNPLSIAHTSAMSGSSLGWGPSMPKSKYCKRSRKKENRGPFDYSPAFEAKLKADKAKARKKRLEKIK
jgi:hypothetical protein